MNLGKGVLNGKSSRSERDLTGALGSHPIRIRVSFKDHRLLANAELLLSASLALYPNLHELVQMHLDQGDVPRRVKSRDKSMTLVPHSGWGRLHRQRRGAAFWTDRPGAGLCGRVTFHPGSLPAQLQVSNSTSLVFR